MYKELCAKVPILDFQSMLGMYYIHNPPCFLTNIDVFAGLFGIYMGR